MEKKEVLTSLENKFLSNSNKINIPSFCNIIGIINIIKLHFEN